MSVLVESPETIAAARREAERFRQANTETQDPLTARQEVDPLAAARLEVERLRHLNVSLKVSVEKALGVAQAAAKGGRLDAWQELAEAVRTAEVAFRGAGLLAYGQAIPDGIRGPLQLVYIAAQRLLGDR